MYAFVVPGQGSQTPGMLSAWLRDPAHAERLRLWSEAADVDLVYLGTKASAAEIARTENTQPLLVAAGLLAHEALATFAGPAAGAAVAAAGHSVGELTAAAYAGALAPVDAVRLAAVRGRAMAAACAETPTSMAAVVGGEEADVLGRIGELGLYAATFNGPGQIVAAGAVADLDRLAAGPPPGATVKRLPVAGAFHTPYMESARRTVAAAAARTPFLRPTGALLSNADGRIVSDPDDLRTRLVEQVVGPVRWDRCLDTLGLLAPDVTVCLPPARTLAAILRRQLPGVATVSVNGPRDLATVRKRLDAVRERIGAMPEQSAPVRERLDAAGSRTAPAPAAASAPATPEEGRAHARL
ncbi:ACP S-malonyltransferase [Streptomyces sp. OUCMDZ-4982]|uniref:ACP S-malonyltransferase n=1 Tax=Streptomyces sp. OUCMDZ-4982 TaxID=2973090 RepID=UPI00215D1EDE|nr:ACP S-malonyltransferase [Streptomyces sp. OUCMDZ-4982]MCR8946269.1 ACP S-malonyltransferase [Streptomyces sp. OUCMDZ-4982]